MLHSQGKWALPSTNGDHNTINGGLQSLFMAFTHYRYLLEYHISHSTRIFFGLGNRSIRSFFKFCCDTTWKRCKFLNNISCHEVFMLSQSLVLRFILWLVQVYKLNDLVNWVWDILWGLVVGHDSWFLKISIWATTLLCSRWWCIWKVTLGKKSKIDL